MIVYATYSIVRWALLNDCVLNTKKLMYTGIDYIPECGLVIIAYEFVLCNDADIYIYIY